MRALQTLILALGLVGALSVSASPFATEIVRATGPFGPTPYHDANSVLGAPATWFHDPFAMFSGGDTNRRVKLVEPAFHHSPTNTGALGTNLLLTLNAGSEIIVRFAQPITNDATHPYGVDLLVFGNSFYTPNRFINEATDMAACGLTGTIFTEPLKVSVSPGFTGQTGEVADDPETWPWYRYDSGPFADSIFPTQAHHWNRATTNWSGDLMDCTKPVNPAMQAIISAGGLTAADAIDLYAGSGGGAGFDLGESGFAWIQYVKVEGVDPDFSVGEVDAFAAVRPMVMGDFLAITPENILSNTATLLFQKPGALHENVVTLAFTEISTVAQVATALVTNWNEFAALPGLVRTAVQLNLEPILGATPVTFATDLALGVGPNYSGTGGDLLVLQSSGTNWNPLPFTYHAPSHQVQITGVTNLSAFVVVQFTAPTLHLTASAANCEISFTPVLSLLHTLERSTNLIHWSALGSFTASNALPVLHTDQTAPADRAFYRVKLSLP